MIKRFRTGFEYLQYFRKLPKRECALDWDVPFTLDKKKIFVKTDGKCIEVVGTGGYDNYVTLGDVVDVYQRDRYHNVTLCHCVVFEH